MARITKWDSVRGCYVIVPDSTQNHIQRLGELEDRDEESQILHDAYRIPACAICRSTLEEGVNFCPSCGQRLKWSEDA